jgi:murein DD-endopeptidase MepM/ murein hydrolase activator NlpD
LAREFFTLIVVPHAKAKFRKFHVSVRLAKWLAGVAGTVALLLTFIVIHYARIAFEVAKLRPLKVENQALQQKTREYEENTGRLQAKVLQLQNQVKKLGIIAGVDQALPDSAVGGVGGAVASESEAPATTHLSFEEMDRSVTELTERSQRLESVLNDQRVVLASTPSIWPVRGYLSAAFGNRADPFTGLRDFHPGIDISTPLGTKVVAPADGVVVFSGPKGAYGNAIMIDHQYGIVTKYGHLDRFNVRAGQRVRRGDVIGFVGNTGRSTAPHLHYEVWVRDQTQNPIHYILDEYRTFG